MHPNGIALSPDEKYPYLNDSGSKKIWRFEIQPDDSAVNGRVWFDESSDSKPGISDGMRVGKAGNIFDSGPGGVWIISPDARHLGTFLLPDRATNLAFRDADGKTLFLVNHTTLYRIRLNVEGVGGELLI